MSIDHPIRISDSSIQPIFIVSAGRSGSTLMRRMLITSPDIHIPPESEDIIPNAAKDFEKNITAGWESQVSCVIRNFERASCFRYWNTSLTALAPALHQVPASERSLARIINDVYRYHGSLNFKQAKTWGDKTPMLIYYLAAINRIFPKARYLYMVRDGRAVVHSHMSSLEYTLEQATSRWIESVHLFESHRDSVDQHQILQIRYEDLITEPAQTLRKVCGFVEVQYAENMIHDISANMGDTVLSHHANVLRPLTLDPINHWKTQMTRERQDYLNHVLKHALSRLGYPV